MLLLGAGGPASAAAASTAPSAWTVGTPIVTYWCGPALSETVVAQMAEGGWNVLWCGPNDLDLLARHRLRGQLTDPLLSPATLDDAAQREKLDALIARVRNHPALYAYYLRDEPNAKDFPALGRLVAYLRERDPAHLAYINLFPTYATNEQLGNKGDVVTAYREHLRQYIDLVRPALISYDHYQFSTRGDNDQYFLNLALIRQASLDAGLPFLNIVQACTWTPSMRVPTPDEMRYLVHTTLAYGAQGISYYVYQCANHTGGIAGADGSPTGLYEALRTLNREFAAIAAQLQPLRSLGVYHAGMAPRGTEPLPEKAAFRLDPPISAIAYQPPERVRGVVIGLFGTTATRKAAEPTHAMVVNLDYAASRDVGIRGPGALEIFDPLGAQWMPVRGRRAEVRLPQGGGCLLRVKP